MQSTAKRKATDDPHDFVVVSSDQVRVAPSDTDELTDLLRAAARHHSESESDNSTVPNRSGPVPVPMVDTAFRATAVNDEVRARRTTLGRRAMRAIAALVLTIGLGAAALSWQTFGYAAKKAVFKLAPKFAISASLPLEKFGLGAKSAPADDPAGADATVAQAASQGAPEGSAPESSTAENGAAGSGPAGNTVVNPAASSSDPAQLMRSMARELANVSQEVEILKASIAELKTSQQQMTRDLAKTSEQGAKAKIVTAPPRPPIAAVHKPAPIYSPTPTTAPPAYRPAPSYSQVTQAPVVPPAPSTAAQPYVPPPPIPLQPQAEPAPRPPLPVQ
jgi:hypothetical protein